MIMLFNIYLSQKVLYDIGLILYEYSKYKKMQVGRHYCDCQTMLNGSVTKTMKDLQ